MVNSTSYRAPSRAQKLFACFAAGSLRRKVISSEQVGCVASVLVWLIQHAHGKNEPLPRRRA